MRLAGGIFLVAKHPDIAINRNFSTSEKPNHTFTHQFCFVLLRSRHYKKTPPKSSPPATQTPLPSCSATCPWPCAQASQQTMHFYRLSAPLVEHAFAGRFGSASGGGQETTTTTTTTGVDAAGPVDACPRRCLRRRRNSWSLGPRRACLECRGVEAGLVEERAMAAAGGRARGLVAATSLEEEAAARCAGSLVAGRRSWWTG